MSHRLKRLVCNVPPHITMAGQDQACYTLVSDIDDTEPPTEQELKKQLGKAYERKDSWFFYLLGHFLVCWIPSRIGLPRTGCTLHPQWAGVCRRPPGIIRASSYSTNHPTPQICRKHQV